MNVGILYIGTGNYLNFWSDFYTNCEKYFLPNTPKKYFLFTDQVKSEAIYIYIYENSDKIKVLKIKHRPWPEVTLNRFATFLQYSSEFDSDYLFFFNANLRCVAPILPEDFLPAGTQNLVATQAMGFFHRLPDEFSYDRNPKSQAYIPFGQGEKYFQGGLQGGTREAFLDACKILNRAVEIDRENGIIAIWHDESHWNKFLLGRQDIKILSPAYLFPEGCNSPIKPKIIVLDKNNYGGHEFMRSNYRNLRAWRIRNLWKPKYLLQFLKNKIHRVIREIWILRKLRNFAKRIIWRIKAIARK